MECHSERTVRTDFLAAKAPTLAVTLFSWDELSLKNTTKATASLGFSRVDIGIFPDRYQVRTAELMRNPLECAGIVKAVLDCHSNARPGPLRLQWSGFR